MKKTEYPRKDIVLNIYEHYKKMDEEYSKKPSSELLEIIDTGYTNPEATDVNWEPIRKAQRELVNRFDYELLKVLNKDLMYELKNIIDQQNKIIDILVNHRHCLDRTYGEKPVW